MISMQWAYLLSRCPSLWVLFMSLLESTHNWSNEILLNVAKHRAALFKARQPYFVYALERPLSGGVHVTCELVEGQRSLRFLGDNHRRGNGWASVTGNHGVHQLSFFLLLHCLEHQRKGPVLSACLAYLGRVTDFHVVHRPFQGLGFGHCYWPILFFY